MWCKARLLESYLPWTGLCWARLNLDLSSPLLHHRHCLWEGSWSCILTLMDVTSCQPPAAGVFCSVPDALQNEFCPLEANTRESEDTDDCRSFLFQHLVAILFAHNLLPPSLGHTGILQSHPAVLYVRGIPGIQGTFPFSFSHKCIQCGSYHSLFPSCKQPL